ncbi:hypothetical protein, partial [Evtepia gabavorous]|uniref:hypothetical protein n=1 Tax=Evtepia gabavorous TaxID=2211183 RepID=UPI003A8FB7C1
IESPLFSCQLAQGHFPLSFLVPHNFVNIDNIFLFRLTFHTIIGTLDPYFIEISGPLPDQEREMRGSTAL